MYNANFRSLVRTMLRQAAAAFSEGINVPEITRIVTEQLRDRDLCVNERLECVYALVYQEAKELFKGPTSSEPLQLDFLLQLGVPQAYAKLLIEINEIGLQVPCEDGKNRIKPLFGKERMTHAELGRAKALIRRKGNETLAQADRLDELYDLDGGYYL